MDNDNKDGDEEDDVGVNNNGIIRNGTKKFMKWYRDHPQETQYTGSV